MAAPLSGLLYLLAVGWASIGVGLLVAYRRSASALVFRLAAAFVGLWAFVATTGLVWMIAHGGLAGVQLLMGAPLSVLEPANLVLVAVGAVGAFSIFVAAFILSQAVGRGYLAVRRPRSIDWPAHLPPPKLPTHLLLFPSSHPEAFSFTLVEPGGRALVRRRNVILLSEGLLALLGPEEVEAVVAHEVGHLAELDGRYLTFFRTLSRLVRWDPILAYLADRLTEREEYRADLDAVALTGRPRTLARALFKAAPLVGAGASPLPGFLGTGGRRGRRQAVERIRRLVELADSGQFPEEPGA